MADGDAEPAAVLGRANTEAGDHPLAAFVVAVKDVHKDGLPGADGSGEVAVVAVVARVAVGDLPEPDVARRDVEVAGQAAELVEVRARSVGARRGHRGTSAVQHGDTGPGVAQGQRQVQGSPGDLGMGAPAVHPRPVVVDPAHLLGRVLDARRGTLWGRWLQEPSV